MECGSGGNYREVGFTEEIPTADANGDRTGRSWLQTQEFGIRMLGHTLKGKEIWTPLEIIYSEIR